MQFREIKDDSVWYSAVKRVFTRDLFKVIL